MDPLHVVLGVVRMMKVLAFPKISIYAPTFHLTVDPSL